MRNYIIEDVLEDHGFKKGWYRLSRIVPNIICPECLDTGETIRGPCDCSFEETDFFNFMATQFEEIRGYDMNFDGVEECWLYYKKQVFREFNLIKAGDDKTWGTVKSEK